MGRLAPEKEAIKMEEHRGALITMMSESAWVSTRVSNRRSPERNLQ